MEFPSDDEEASGKRSKPTRRRKTREVPKVDENLDLKLVKPITKNQEGIFADYEQRYNLLLLGSAGTGKTFVSLYLALRNVLDRRTKQVRVVIVRSAVPTRDIGFLPGGAREKLAVYESPYQAMCSELFGRADAYEVLKMKKLVHFVPTSFIRGTTIEDSVIIVDECQNLTGHELDSIITRCGANSRIIFCGDFGQSDFTKEHEKSGLKAFMDILEHMTSFATTVLTEDDIVRGAMVKDYIVNKNKLGVHF
jgi:phosphate starvation-inducible PhoH-like protein